MNARRHLCSQLISLRNTSDPAARQFVVNLEEIWGSGAVIESEEALEEAARVELHCGKIFFAGRIVKVEKHEFGWRADIEFSPMTPWKPEEFQPEHLLEL